MVRYPREGHGMREVGHVQDWLTRSLKWYDDHFQGNSSSRIPHPQSSIPNRESDWGFGIGDRG